MKDYICIGSAPALEDCAQVGSDNYHERSRKETAEFIRMLNAKFPPPNDGDSRFTTKAFSHDFGIYREVVAFYDTDNKASVEWAYAAEADAPEKWDAEAIKALGK